VTWYSPAPRGHEIAVTFGATLHERQVQAINAVLAHDGGVLVAPPVAGGTVMACAIIAERAMSTLVLVDRDAAPPLAVSRLRRMPGYGALGFGPTPFFAGRTVGPCADSAPGTAPRALCAPHGPISLEINGREPTGLRARRVQPACPRAQQAQRSTCRYWGSSRVGYVRLMATRTARARRCSR